MEGKDHEHLKGMEASERGFSWAHCDDKRKILQVVSRSKARLIIDYARFKIQLEQIQGDLAVHPAMRRHGHVNLSSECGSLEAFSFLKPRAGFGM
jgi:hypothetical protein